ncbi:STAS domain-containing protein [Actinacidiphila alni]|uniref:STAS domain-containing protein n=1 Tax=Actinacidiphila alni TaxID=380248 RepID=UPI003452D277
MDGRTGDSGSGRASEGTDNGAGRAGRSGERRTVVIAGAAELDWEGSQKFGAELQAAVDDGADTVVADLSGTVFADSTVLLGLLTAHTDLTARGGRLIISGPLAPPVRMLFKVTGVSEHVDYADSVDAARAGTVRTSTPDPAP